MQTATTRTSVLTSFMVCGAVIGALLLPGPAIAHHGTRVSYDWTSTVTVTGVLTEFVTKNPHSFLMLDVAGEDGEVVTWGAETASLNALNRNGISKETLKLGDEITISLYPSRAGTPRGQHILTEPTIINGVPAKAGSSRAPPAVAASSVPDNEQYDPRDLSGVWMGARRNSVTGEDGPFFIADPAPMTAEGQAKYDSQLPSYGPRAIPPGLGNDPSGICNPLGLVRTLVVGRPVEFLQGDKKVTQLFENGRTWRSIWTDGREFPDDLAPKWFGYSIGYWEDDTFVVETRSLDERSWLDPYANPLSDDMRVVERWTRTGHATMELEMTLHDPKIYTDPVISPLKIFQLQPNRGLNENICAPVDEISFNEKIRDPAGGRGILEASEWEGETGYKEGEGQREAYQREAEARDFRPFVE